MLRPQSRIARWAFWICIAALLVLSNALILSVDLGQGSKDWQNFWAAGGTVGSAALLDQSLHRAWQFAHHLPPQAFVYPPAVAWFYVPAFHLSLETGLLLNCIVSLVLAVLGGLLAAGIYGISRMRAILGILAWAPVSNAALLGQHAGFALVLYLLVVVGLVKRSPLITGLSVGCLLYKPQEALAFVLLLVLLREWRTLGITAIFATLWYFASVAATAGDWSWPFHYVALLQGYYRLDFIDNASRAISLPGVLMHLGAPEVVAWLVGLALLIVGAVVLARKSRLEAASIIGLIGVAASAHAWPYDAVMLLPGLFYIRTMQNFPLQGYLIQGTYLVAPFWVFSRVLGWDPLAIAVLGLTLLWFYQQTPSGAALTARG